MLTRATGVLDQREESFQVWVPIMPEPELDKKAM